MSMTSRARVRSRICPVPTVIPARRRIRPKRTTFFRRWAKSSSEVRRSTASRFCTCRLHQRSDAPIANLLDIVLIFEQRTKRIDGKLLVERDRSERREGACPVQSFGHSGQLVEILLAKLLNEPTHLPCQLGRDLRSLGRDDQILFLERRVVDPVVQAA